VPCPTDWCRTRADRRQPLGRTRIKFQGLPARIFSVGPGERARRGLAFNEMTAKGEVKAPIIIGRDHLESGSVASPNRETEGMWDGSDAVSGRPLRNALLNCASGATRVSTHFFARAISIAHPQFRTAHRNSYPTLITLPLRLPGLEQLLRVGELRRAH